MHSPPENSSDACLRREAETILLIGTEEFCQEARRELQRKHPRLRVTCAYSFEAASLVLERGTPGVILAEDRVLAGQAALRERRAAIAATLSLLVGHAPVVWIGNEEDRSAILSQEAMGEIDFVPRSALCVPSAVTIAGRRLRLAAAQTPRKSQNDLSQRPSVSLGDLALGGRDFGEVLRHELNNPLTGILGNAELLLLEVRRGRLELGANNLQRLEIIADLAVRMREAVRQLSDRWLGDVEDAAPEKSAVEEPHWPLSG